MPYRARFKAATEMAVFSNERVLLTGGSGLLALNWAVTASRESTICLLQHRKRVDVPGCESKICDLSRRDDFMRIADHFQPTLIAHTAGMTNVDACQSNPEEARLANAQLAGTVADYAGELGVQLVHLSTDHIFSGRCQMVTEEASPAPVNEYARSKHEGESLVIERNAEALIVRTNFYGWGPAWRPSFSDWIIGELASNRPIHAFQDVYYTPILIADLLALIHLACKQNARGILHLAGAERVSKFDFARCIAATFDYPEKLIQAARTTDLPGRAPRPADMSLSTDKAMRLLGQPLPDMQSGVTSLLEQKTNGHAARIQALTETTQ